MDNTHPTVKPAKGLLIFALSISLVSQTFSLSVLLSISLPLFMLFLWILLPANGLRVHWWLLPLLAGALVSSLYATHYAFTRLDGHVQGRDIDIVGKVASLPVITGMATRFDFAVSHSESGQYPGKVRLSWYEAPYLQAGQTWHITVRLRQPHGFSSPGAFDYEAWLLRQGIQATGYVKSGALLNEQVTGVYRLQQVRAHLRQWLYSVVSDDNRGIFSALLLGDKTAINTQQWQMFNETGTTHLMVISGLHIGLMAWLGFSLATIVGRFGGIPLRTVPLPVVKVLTGLLFALFYALLAGFSVPVQRALVMTFAALLAPSVGIRASPLTLWLLALAAVLAIDPLAITSNGFWYSFIAVAALLFGMAGRRNRGSWWATVLKPQWLVFVLLTPLLLFNGQPVSPLSPLVNLLAIPLIGIAVVPLLLFSALVQYALPEVASFIIAGLDCLVTGFQSGLTWVSGLMVLIPPQQGLSWPDLFLAVAGMLLLIAPATLRLRWLAPVMLMPSFCSKPLVIPAGQAEVTVLDVGQGLSVLIRTHQHLMVYDTGDRFSEKMSAAESVILPALAKSGVTQIDRIMISHGDQDHSGGLPSLLSRYPDVPVVSGTRLPGLEKEWVKCQPGDHWIWDGVYFQVLAGGDYRRSNDSSCVLKVTAGTDSLLLPGDISGRVEKRLIEQGTELKASVLVAAHHGSRFSSSSEFLSIVQPGAIIFSSGFANRFGHPAPETVARVQNSGAETFNTAEDGSLSFTLGSGNIKVSAYRKTHSRYWWR
ncbi:DNA internalization-related competence protein ComEC/Rec2 [Endozoicomonas sp. SCSIO W0465]|uniref:DNA internalization-related competence protein ComEC/Rec2 n=1 Tax=Endozoicomonas sp. SCSIO W0465 TaxID=2918516 RepID=UPI002075E81C|nr:DNA internalization-related competence protein ComEC/Rec2 [Endozoicomonas sp. SCSIO W0465]USE34408.1 DNA internalization-related competence protein ComEC/Rec2 [Endozoicomonas sp. SCSIO W0465]